ncbi:MAG: di-heme-cytochrome C peroxidase, partial [Thermoguttaceae bacterium]
MGRFRPLAWPVAIVAIVLFVLCVLLFDVLQVFSINPPRAAAVTGYLELSQNWSPEDANWAHHTSQGTRIMRYDWFMAMEQPDLAFIRSPKFFHESDYLQRFGFLPDTREGKYSNRLPVGFATEDEFQEPFGNSMQRMKPYKVVGLTCAACHTGQINYRGNGIRIEGGHSLVDLAKFQAAVGLAIAYTVKVPFRFDRFARRVLGENYHSETRADLWAELNELIKQGLDEKHYADSKHLYDTKGGPGRTDALGLIANRAFTDLDSKDNLAMADAPVKFPVLWDTPWFDWVQYNASIRPPMVRNIGEALGVGALVVTDESNGSLYDSTVNVKNLHRLEDFIAGSKAFEGLRSPAWPQEILGEFKPLRVAAGRTLYMSRCAACHPLVSELRASRDAPSASGWTSASQGVAGYDSPRKLIKLKVINLKRIGTDPAQALNLQKRVVFTSDTVLGEGLALLQLTSEIRKRKYRELGLTHEQELEYDGYRFMPAGDVTRPEAALQAIAGNLGYRARPLDGVWAAAPYLHNGSVPNLFELLSPVET